MSGAQIDRLLVARKTRAGHRGVAEPRPEADFVWSVAYCDIHIGWTANRAVWIPPSAKLEEKSRDGAKVKRRHEKPLTPCERLLGNPDVDAASKRKLQERRSPLNRVGRRGW
jgi:hypothetical protein